MGAKGFANGHDLIAGRQHLWTPRLIKPMAGEVKCLIVVCGPHAFQEV